MKKIMLIVSALFITTGLFAQEEDKKKKENVKTGFSMGGVPVIAYDADTGFKYGGLVNFYHYGDGSNYPNYDHSLYLEWSRTTKGSGINQLTYDALTLIPNTRVTFDVSYLTEQALNFYGFNGYEADYNSNYELTGDDSYISRMYYRHSRKLFRTTLDFQGNLKGKELRWLAGFAHYRANIETVDIDRLNEGKESDLLPDTMLLYDKYVEWGVIPDDQAIGGNVTYLKAGAVYDTRDNEANPNKGLFSEALIITAPGFIGNGDYGFTKLLFTHRQYFTIFPDRLTFAYRLSYQTKIAGEMPFYMLPYAVDSKRVSDGLGGSKNIRGVLRNRVVGDGVAFGNFELRSKFFKTIIFKQNFYLGLNLFTDVGMVTSPYSLDEEANIPADELQSFVNASEGLHLGYGAGVRFVINSNFIIAVDYGIAGKPQDGETGFYVNLNYLF